MLAYLNVKLRPSWACLGTLCEARRIGWQGGWGLKPIQIDRLLALGAVGKRARTIPFAQASRAFP